MHLALFDGLNLIRRIYAGVPGEEGNQAHDDAVLDACRRSLFRALTWLRPSHAVIALEHGAVTWRHRLHPAYKAGRKPMPEALSRLLPNIEEAFASMSVRTIRVAGFEADDIIASVAVRLAEQMSATIISTDKGYLPLIGDSITVRNHFEGQDRDAAYVRQRFGVSPGNLPTYLALVGDRAHGIPGVHSIGAKMAAKLVAGYGHLEDILAAAAELPAHTQSALCKGQDDARLSLQLVTLRTDVTIGLKLSDFRCEMPDPGNHPGSPPKN